MIRLKDIAESAGVSVMTVSKALRDEPDISNTTKTRIKDIADQVGYVPNNSARGLRTNITKQFGLIISSLSNPVYIRTFMAIEERTHEMGYEIIVAQTLNDPEREDACIRRLLARQVDGLFIRPVYRPDSTAAIYEELQKRKTPTVILGHRALFCSDFPNVETDDIAASQSAIEHLLELGHHRIACLTGPAFAPWAQERYEGYRRALLEQHIDVDESLIFQAGSTIEEGAVAALQMIDEDPEATALIAANDLVAIGAASTLLDQGVEIPSKMSVVGFGNTLTAEYFRVPLTTVSQPKYRRGTAAIESMERLLAGEAASFKRLTADLVIRKSTSAPPA
jgi:LacI family transcriptional regulator